MHFQLQAHRLSTRSHRPSHARNLCRLRCRCSPDPSNMRRPGRESARQAAARRDPRSRCHSECVGVAAVFFACSRDGDVCRRFSSRLGVHASRHRFGCSDARRICGAPTAAGTHRTRGQAPGRAWHRSPILPARCHAGARGTSAPTPDGLPRGPGSTHAAIHSGKQDGCQRFGSGARQFQTERRA